jgi:hypothetical protein
MNDICFELSSSWRSDFDTTPIKLQRIRDRQRLPPLFLRKLRGEVRGIVGQVANAYRSKHMCALSRPAVIQTCLSSSATPILIRPGSRESQACRQYRNSAGHRLAALTAFCIADVRIMAARNKDVRRKWISFSFAASSDSTSRIAAVSRSIAS